MRGRKPTPTALKIVRANPGKRPLPQAEPRPGLDVVTPDWLSTDARKHWPLIATQLSNAGILTNIDAPALALYCESFVIWKQAYANVLKYGLVVKAQSGFPVQSPFLSIANQQSDRMVHLLAEFGMTPSSRSRVTATKPDDASPYAKFVKRPQ